MHTYENTILPLPPSKTSTTQVHPLGDRLRAERGAHSFRKDVETHSRMKKGQPPPQRFKKYSVQLVKNSELTNTTLNSNPTHYLQVKHRVQETDDERKVNNIIKPKIAKAHHISLSLSLHVYRGKDLILQHHIVLWCQTNASTEHILQTRSLFRQGVNYWSAGWNKRCLVFSQVQSNDKSC